MIGSVLIANRGEIARRIIRTAQRLGVRTIAIYSEADADAPHVREADQAALIGPPPARESYLDVERVLAAAKATDAEAIHPGYGFLSENAAFAEAVIAAGRVWVGPPPAAIRAMGLKDAAKRLMAEAGVPTTPGYLGDDQAAETLAREAASIGFPVLIKAVAGGGGKGMRRVEQASDFAAALDAARREAASSFGDDRVLLERYVTRPRHIEVQVFGDSHGNIIHLFERDCSLQRRHQKVVEEAPAPGMDAATRAQLCDAAVRAAKAVNYVGAGTIEFIADASEGLRADRIWFMEMNTRLQVEHPVTEAITGLDLVEWQLRVASGEPLPLTQDQIEMAGHAIEARLYAEDPAKGFLPSTGRLRHFELPRTVRVDSGVEIGGEIGPFYDPMIAKLIAHAPTRTEAAVQLAAACRAVEVWPVRTNASFLDRCLREPDFVGAHIDTAFIERRLEGLTRRAFSLMPTLAAVSYRLEDQMALYAINAETWSSSPHRLLGFRLNTSPAPMTFKLQADDAVQEIVVRQIVRGADLDWTWDIAVDGVEISSVPQPDFEPHLPTTYGDDPLYVFENGAYQEFRPFRSVNAVDAAETDGKIVAPMPGRIASLAVAPGEGVTRGQTLVTLEAMKMEHALTAPFDGVADEVRCEVGDQVTEGALLLVLSAKP